VSIHVCEDKEKREDEDEDKEKDEAIYDEGRETRGGKGKKRMGVKMTLEWIVSVYDDEGTGYGVAVVITLDWNKRQQYSRTRESPPEKYPPSLTGHCLAGHRNPSRRWPWSDMSVLADCC
jgi:hypothetical protein